MSGEQAGKLLLKLILIKLLNNFLCVIVTTVCINFKLNHEDSKTQSITKKKYDSLLNGKNNFQETHQNCT